MEEQKLRTYSYKVLNSDGTISHGNINALDLKSAEFNLKKQGLLIKSLLEKNQTAKIKKYINHDDFIQFISEFTSLNKAGLTVPEAIEQCSDRPSNKNLSAALKGVLKLLHEGETLSSAISHFPDIFDSVMFSAVKTGESSGDLFIPLTKYKIHIERRNNMRKKIIQSVTYPAFILAVMLLILSGLFIFVMPRFISLYADFNAELPAATKAFLFLSENIVFLLPVIITALVILLFSGKWLVKNRSVSKFLDKLRNKIPLAGPIFEKLDYSSLAGTLNTLITGGMPLAEALKTATASIKNSIYAETAQRVMKKIHDGRKFTQAAADEHLFPATAIKLLQAGESSGNIGPMLEEVSVYYERSAESGLTVLMSVIEPVMILFTGVIVGTVIVVMYLPVFRLTEIIK